MTAPTLRSDRHALYDLDYEERIAGSLLRDHSRARVATAHLEAEHIAHPHLSAIFSAIRALEAQGRSPSIPAVREHLIARRMPAAVPWIAIALDSYIPSADGPRLRLFADRILKLAELRRLLALADSVDSVLGNRSLDGSSRIETAHEEMKAVVTGFVSEQTRAVA